MNRWHLVIVAVVLGAVAALAAQAAEPILEIDTGGHKAVIRKIMFTADGRYLISASDDKTVRVWDVSTAPALSNVEGLNTGVKTGETARVLRGEIGAGPEGQIFAAALSPDNRLLAVGGFLPGNYESRHSIRLLDFQTGAVVGLLKGHENVINGLAFSPDGSKLISGSGDKTARIWELPQDLTGFGKPVRSIELQGHTDFIFAVAFAPDGKTAVTGSDDGTLKLWDVSTAPVLSNVEGLNTGVRSGKLIATLTGHTDKVCSAAFTPDGKYLLSGSWDKTIRLWDGKTGKFIKVLATQDAGVVSLTISPDGTKVLTGNGVNPVYVNNVFSIPAGELLKSFTQHDSSVFATAISPDGKLAATGGGQNNVIYLWDVQTGKVQQTFSGKGQPVLSVGFAPDGAALAWGKTQNVQKILFDHGPLEQAFTLTPAPLPGGEGQEFAPLTPRPLGEGPGVRAYLRGAATAGAYTIRTPDGKIHPTLQILKDGKVIHEITRELGDGFYSLTLTPDGKTIIAGTAWALIAFDTETGKELRKFVGHEGVVWGVAVSPDGKLLVSGSWDQTVKLWDIAAGTLLLTIFQSTDNEWVAWTPQGYYTASLNGDKYIGWHINQGADQAALYYPASRFAKQFYNPELVAAYLATSGDLDKALALVNARKPPRQQVTETTAADVLRMSPPAVVFQIPAERDVTVTEDRIRIKAVAKSVTQEPVTKMWVLVNGSTLPPSTSSGQTGEKGKAALPPKLTLNGLTAELDLLAPLTQPENKIAVIAANQYKQSEPEIITVRWQKAQPKLAELEKPNLYLLAVGVSEYQDRNLRLTYANKDAADLTKELQAQRGKLYNLVETRLLTNREATRDAVLDGLEWLLKAATQKDTAVIFVSGHGTKDSGGNYYFMPYDVKPDSLRSTGVKWDDFNDVIKRLPSKILLLADTCHSGGITGQKGLNDLTDALRDLVQSGSGVVVMTASTGQEVSREDPNWGNGAFTKAMLEGLAGQADYNKDNVVDIKELDLYITNRVKELTDGSQHPTTAIPKTMPNFPVVYRQE